MGLVNRIEERIVGANRSIFQRVWYVFLTIILLIFLDFFSGFPLGIIQLNQLEQLEKIEGLLKSSSLSCEDKEVLIMEEKEVFSRYDFLSNLRFSLSRELSSAITRKTTIASIDSSIKSSITAIPNFLCSNLAYTFSFSFIIVIFLLSGIIQIPSSTDIMGDLAMITFLIILEIISYYLICYIPKFDVCINNHILYACLHITFILFIWYKSSGNT